MDDRIDDRLSNVSVVVEIELGGSEMRNQRDVAEQLENMAIRLRAEHSIGIFITPQVAGFTSLDRNGNRVGLLTYRFDMEDDPAEDDGT